MTDDWFEHLINNMLIPILPRLNHDTEISKSPLIQVTEKDDDTVTLLILGEIPFFSGAATAFMRIKVKIGKILKNSQLDIQEWITVIGDLNLGKEDLFEARLRFGYDNSSGTGVFSGTGAIKIIPADFGMDLVLGGLSDRGCMLGLKVETPIAIPLGSTGLGIKAIGGDFAYNFIANLVDNPNAADYVNWAQKDVPDRWISGAVNLTSVGIGISCGIVTLADQGRMINLDNAGIAVLTPGPVFILGGKGSVLLGVAEAEGYLALDIDSGSIALGLGADLSVPPDSGAIIDGSGQLDAFFSFKDPSLWYVYFGQIKTPISVKALRNLLNASVFYMVDNHQMAFGGALSIGFDWSWWKVSLYAHIGIEAACNIGWNPFLLGAYFKLWGDLGFELFGIRLALNASAKANGTISNPCKLVFGLDLTIDLPWPIPNIDFSKEISFSDEHPQPPELSPVLAEVENQKLGALHAISGRQWLLGTEKAWPDLEIVIPFHCRLIDMTETQTYPYKVVIGAGGDTQNQGGYEIHHELNEVTLLDTVNNRDVPIHGVWANSQGGETARLHLLGQDPYSWLTPHITPGYTFIVANKKSNIQYFGWGEAETFTTEKRFGEMLIEPAISISAELLTDYAPDLQTRVLACDDFKMRFATTTDAAIPVEKISLFLVCMKQDLEDTKLFFTAQGFETSIDYNVQELFGDICLVKVTLNLEGQQVDQVSLQSGGGVPLLVYAVSYTEKRKSLIPSQPKQILMPGKYKLTVTGCSYVGSPELQPTNKIPWEVTQEFEVVYPNQLRPYIQYTTLGDYRLFNKGTSNWNPTQYGYGFPHYQKYKGVIHFLAPYMSKIFTGDDNPVEIELDSDGSANSEPITIQLGFTKDPDGTSSALIAVHDWVAANPGITSYNLRDEELVLPEKEDYKSGPLHLSIWYKPPNGNKLRLDEWTAYISQFENFAAHLAWNEHYLRITYVAIDKTIQPSDAPSRKTLTVPVKPSKMPGAATQVQKTTKTSWKSLLLGLADRFKLLGALLPTEYSMVPAGWELPTQLAQYLQPLDGKTAIRFACFASETGIQFVHGESTQECLNEVVPATTIEALLDSSGKTYALWLRTPEPVDWRRVTASLKIKHVVFQIGRRPSYSLRSALKLNISIIPSPDASSAFLIGAFKGKHCLLPCGEYELTLKFDPFQAELWKLRPGDTISSPEAAVLKFMHPVGINWPKPPKQGSPVTPPLKPDVLRQVKSVLPGLMRKAEAGSLSRGDYNLLFNILDSLPEGLVNESFQSVFDEDRNSYQRRIRMKFDSPDQNMMFVYLRRLLADLKPLI